MRYQNVAKGFMAVLLTLMWCGFAGVALAGSEIKGAEILNHPCGKVAVKQMGLVHAGKMKEANQLTTATMQQQWKAMPDQDRAMMMGMMQALSKTEDEYADDIRKYGLLVVNGTSAVLTIKKTSRDANVTSTETTTQRFALNGAQCLISR